MEAVLGFKDGNGPICYFFQLNRKARDLPRLRKKNLQCTLTGIKDMEATASLELASGTVPHGLEIEETYSPEGSAYLRDIIHVRIRIDFNTYRALERDKQFKVEYSRGRKIRVTIGNKTDSEIAAGVFN